MLRDDEMWKLLSRDLSSDPGWGWVNRQTHLLRQTADGRFDYFPQGLHREGYRIDSETRERIIRAEGKVARWLWAVLALIIAMAVIVLVLQIVGLHWTRGLNQFWLVAFVAVIAALAAWDNWRRRRRLIKEVLRDKPRVHMPEEEYGRLVAQRWKRTPKLWLVIFPLIFLWVGGQLIRGVGRGLGAEHWLIMGIFFAMGLQKSAEAIAMWRWSRKFPASTVRRNPPSRSQS
jgi:hypothetical protein